MKTLLAILMILPLAACGSDDSQQDILNPEEEYLKVVRENAPSTEAVDDDLLITAAENNCDLLDAGATTSDIVNVFNNSNIPADMTGTILGAGTAAFCPEYADEIKSDLGIE